MTHFVTSFTPFELTYAVPSHALVSEAFSPRIFCCVTRAAKTTHITPYEPWLIIVSQRVCMCVKWKHMWNNGQELSQFLFLNFLATFLGYDIAKQEQYIYMQAYYNISGNFLVII